jgi:tRNA (guanine-N7-)-methyltransferase
VTRTTLRAGTVSGPNEPSAARSFHGRRKGKALRPQRAERLERLLPALKIAAGDAPLDPGRLCSRPIADLHLEIGFGGGEHLLARALENPGIGFIGCEPFINGLAKLIDAIEANGLANIRLFDDDARLLIDRLPAGSVGRVYLLYPDPWPKRRQRKRRFVSAENLAALARAMKPGAELRFATDIDDYAGWTLARILASADFLWPATGADDWRRPWAEWQSTRYEAKALKAGRKPIYLTFLRAP